MEHPGFFERAAPIRLEALAQKVGAGLGPGGAAHPKEDVAAGARMGGTPAIPLTEWARQLALLKRLTQREGYSGGG